MRLLTWNLFHGRSVPDAPHSLLAAFQAALAEWRWDVALLQEVPPWWSADLARATGADWARTVLTSRNELLALRRAVADRRPSLLGSAGGGANVILVRRSGGTVCGHSRHGLTCWPERRVVHAVQLRRSDGVLWIANLHASQARPLARARRDGERAATWLTGLAGDAPLVLGGDFNDRAPVHPPLRAVASHSVDHILASAAVVATSAARTLSRETEIDGDPRQLSDHVPLAVSVEVRPHRR